MPSQILQNAYLDLMKAESTNDLRTELVRFAKSLGFATVSAVTVIDHPRNNSEFRCIDNVPEAYASDTFYEAGLHDPVMQHCKNTAVPIIWDQDTYVACGQGEMWEHQAKYGFRTGVAVALHMPNGRHFVLGADRDRPLPKSPRAMTRIVADLQLLAVHAQDAAFRLLAPQQPDALTGPSLTPRELEALQWTMEGKTAWEVGSIMGISERTAVLHIQNAMHKLESINKHQAVLKALRLGLLS